MSGLPVWGHDVENRDRFAFQWLCGKHGASHAEYAEKNHPSTLLDEFVDALRSLLTQLDFKFARKLAYLAPHLGVLFVGRNKGHSTYDLQTTPPFCRPLKLNGSILLA